MIWLVATDRVNSMAMVLGGTAAKVADGIQLNNISAPRNAYTYLNASHNTLLNQLVNTEFTCIIDCLIKFGETGKLALIADFGSLGGSTSGIAVLAAVGQNGGLSCNPKYNGKSEGFSEKDSTPTGADTIELNQYVSMRVKLGARLVDGKQEVYAEANGLKGYGLANTPLKVNFSGCGGSTNWAFGLGVVYLNGSSVSQYASNYCSDVIYQKILLYNKAK